MLPCAGELKAKAGTFFYKNVAWPVITQMSAETSHNFAVMTARYGLTPWDRVPDDPILKTTVLGLEMRAHPNHSRMRTPTTPASQSPRDAPACTGGM